METEFLRVLKVTLVVGSFLYVGLLFFIFGINGIPLAARDRMDCKDHLKQIGLALHNYHDTHGCFPPAYLADETGRPVHSWRVLILPFLGERELYEEYDFDEPWDGPHNSRLASRVPEVFQCPQEDRSERTESWTTSYVAITGAGTAFEAGQTVKIEEILDGTANTVLVTEVPGRSIWWTEPRDVSAEVVHQQLTAESDEARNHEGGANFLWVDGSIRFISGTIPKDRFEALTTIAGGEEPGFEY